ncbi:hypothetical protein [Streptomyces sp. NPDC008139]|uniref:hypothetical protein n=1 Tax=Streptomyces sp. NPDC008139 TaxID=3364814 RepID=UPI0036E29577
MDISGHSSDFVTDSAFYGALTRFADSRLRRWPGLHIDGRPVEPGSLPRWDPPAATAEEPPGVETGPEIVTFSRGPEMEEFWEEQGYALDAAGEGPFSVLYSASPHPLHARRITEVVRAGAGEEDLQTVEGIGLLLSHYLAVSLITPDDPATDAFSASVRDDFLAAFGV